MNRRHFLQTSAAVLAAAAGCNSTSASSRVVLYCAQDRVFAESVLAEFTQRTKLDVAPKYDTEADKSVSLYEELIREKDRPRCDVHWNNEILATIRLRRAGLLEPCSSPSAAPYPDWSKAPDHTWQAFASRARVLLVNMKLVPEVERPKSLLELTQPKWKGKVAMAKPLFGTTATQAACLFEAMGPERAEQFYKNLAANGVQIVPGNKQAAEAVSHGEVAIGVTDTDDAMEEKEGGQPVDIIFPDREKNSDFPRMGTLYIPNTLALIRGAPNADGGKKLIDFLLSAEVEQKLADNASHQIPLNPQVKAKLPEVIVAPSQVHVMDVDFEKAADMWERSQTFLRNLFAR
ncbi:MAG TPA: extracellular solute-binding protein [Gemmataceae bacterium]|nr:extracellular solute-binding protein [Gemmataceae bacterium]